MTASNSHRNLPGAPSLVEHKKMRFLIINKPTQSTMPQFIKVNTYYAVTCIDCVLPCLTNCFVLCDSILAS